MSHLDEVIARVDAAIEESVIAHICPYERIINRPER